MRSAWVMRLKPGQEAEYKRKHDEIWPEMVALLKSQGIHNYSIYRHGLTLFAHLERPESAPAAEPDEVIRRWWKWMEPHGNPSRCPAGCRSGRRGIPVGLKIWRAPAREEEDRS